MCAGKCVQANAKTTGNVCKTCWINHVRQREEYAAELHGVKKNMLPPLQLLGDHSPLAPVEPTEPTRYPLSGRDAKLMSDDGKGTVTMWSIGEVCGCFGMYNIGLSCCCAFTDCGCCQSLWTWTNALEYAGVDPKYAALFAAAAAVDLGDDVVANTVEAGLDAGAAYAGVQARRELAKALGLRAGGFSNFFLRLLCTPCLHCQETNQVMLFYRDSLGYEDVRYGPVCDFGSCTCCQCCFFFSKGRKIPFPGEFLPDEAGLPRYPGVTGPVKFLYGKPVKVDTGEAPKEQKMFRGEQYSRIGKF